MPIFLHQLCDGHAVSSVLRRSICQIRGRRITEIHASRRNPREFPCAIHKSRTSIRKNIRPRRKRRHFNERITRLSSAHICPAVIINGTPMEHKHLSGLIGSVIVAAMVLDHGIDDGITRRAESADDAAFASGSYAAVTRKSSKIERT